MTQHNLLDAVEKLLPYAEAEQEAFYKVTLKYPGRQKAKSDYEDCRHAVSYAYEALSEATRKTLPTAAAQTEGKHTPGPWGADYYADHVSYYSPARKDDYAFRVEFPDNLPEAEAAATAALIGAAPEMLDALEFVAMTFADIEASKRKGYYTECPKIVAAAIAKATA